jgi:hypothetical protein
MEYDKTWIEDYKNYFLNFFGIYFHLFFEFSKKVPNGAFGHTKYYAHFQYLSILLHYCLCWKIFYYYKLITNRNPYQKLGFQRTGSGTRFTNLVFPGTGSGTLFSKLGFRPESVLGTLQNIGFQNWFQSLKITYNYKICVPWYMPEISGNF